MLTLVNGVWTLAVIGSAVTSSGVVRSVVSSWPYTPVGGTFHAGWELALADAFHSAVWLGVAARLHADYTGLDITLYDDPWVEEGGSGLGYKPADGAQPGPRLPLHHCVAVSLRTDFQGHAYVGRRRLGPIAAADLNGGLLTQDAFNLWEDVAGTFSDQLTLPFGQTWLPVVLSRTYSERGPPPVYVGAPITWTKLSPLAGLCRHRRQRTPH